MQNQIKFKYFRTVITSDERYVTVVKSRTGHLKVKFIILFSCNCILLTTPPISFHNEFDVFI